MATFRRLNYVNLLVWCVFPLLALGGAFAFVRYCVWGAIVRGATGAGSVPAQASESIYPKIMNIHPALATLAILLILSAVAWIFIGYGIAKAPLDTELWGRPADRQEGQAETSPETREPSE